MSKRVIVFFLPWFAVCNPIITLISHVLNLFDSQVARISLTRLQCDQHSRQLQYPTTYHRQQIQYILILISLSAYAAWDFCIAIGGGKIKPPSSGQTHLHRAWRPRPSQTRLICKHDFCSSSHRLYSASSHAAFCGAARFHPRSTIERLQLPWQQFGVSCPLYYMLRLSLPSLHDYIVLRSFSHMMPVGRPIHHHHGVGKGLYTPCEQIIYQRPLHSSLLLRSPSHCLRGLIALTSYQTPLFILFQINHASQARSTDEHSFGANMFPRQKYICPTSALQTRARCKRNFETIK